ncbi:MAG: hypothetical protein LRY37_01395 [Alkalibacterium thalassium]|nr:hypothetical protein [Alkalibacterium thalassium]
MTQTLIFDLDDTILDFKKGEQSGLSKVLHPIHRAILNMKNGSQPSKG